MKVTKLAIQTLQEGGIGVLATDTIYGVVGSALSQRTVERLYDVRQRDRKKPFIVLIGSMFDLDLFNVKLQKEEDKVLREVWPGKVSVILPVLGQKFDYLHRGTYSIAFRLPDKKSLADILKETGPLVAPSANIEGEPPANTIGEAEKYFGNTVDFYIDSGKISSKPSKLIKITKNGIETLR